MAVPQGRQCPPTAPEPGLSTGCCGPPPTPATGPPASVEKPIPEFRPPPSCTRGVLTAQSSEALLIRNKTNRGWRSTAGERKHSRGEEAADWSLSQAYMGLPHLSREQRLRLASPVQKTMTPARHLVPLTRLFLLTLSNQTLFSVGLMWPGHQRGQGYSLQERGLHRGALGSAGWDVSPPSPTLPCVISDP